jgi:hypothetical protein
MLKNGQMAWQRVPVEKAAAAAAHSHINMDVG